MKGYIHHDITAYDPKIKAPFVGRISRKFLLGLVVTLVIGFTLFVLLNRVLRLWHYPAALISAVVAFPFGFVAQFKRQGMNAVEYWMAKRTWEKQLKPLTYSVNEHFSTFERLSDELIIIGKR
jgi:hypothetical protein